MLLLFYRNLLLSITALYHCQTFLLISQILLPWKKWFVQESACLAAMSEGKKDTFLLFNEVYYLLLVIFGETGLGKGVDSGGERRKMTKSMTAR